MKKTIVLISLIFLLAIGCEKKQSKVVPSKESKKIDTINIKPIINNENISLLYNLTHNTILKYKLNTYSKNTQILHLDSLISGYVTQNVTYFFDVKVKEKEKDGKLTLDIFCKEITASSESSTGEKFQYDSKNPPTDSLGKIISKNFEILSGVNFSVRITPTGEILDIFRSDNILDKLLMDAPRKPSNEERQQIKVDIEQGVLIPLVQQIFKILPDKSINVDSTWVQSYPFQISVFELQNEAQYRVNRIFESNNKKLVEIFGTLNALPSGKTDYTEGNISYKFSKPKISGNSKIYYDLDKKCIRNAVSEVNLELAVNINQKGNPRTYKKIDKIETKNTLTLLD